MTTPIQDRALPSPPYEVLVVDDDPVHRTLELAILDSPRYRVTEASSGAMALDLLRRTSVDVVLLDKRMPGLDGDEVCRRIRGELGLPMLPVLMVTGDGDLDNLSLSLDAGATDFVRKPYDPTELLARLEAAASHKRLTDQLDSAESMLFALARMVETKDGNTGDHCTRLSHTGVVLGRALGLGADELLALRRGGVLHDIGKLGIPDGVLLKPGALTDAEWVVMRQHVEIGARLIGGLRSMRLTVPIVRHHHERWDGSGYPDGLQGEAIPLLARVFQIVDIFDALQHPRPYKPAMALPEVVAVMQAEADRGWRDPRLMREFLAIVHHQPQLLQPPKNGQDDLGQALYSSIQVRGG